LNRKSREIPGPAVRAPFTTFQPVNSLKSFFFKQKSEMKAKVFQIVWHALEGAKNEPIWSLDCHPVLPLLATAGMDSTVRLWKFSDPHSLAAADSSGGAGRPSAGGPVSSGVDFRFTISAHNKPVNVVRWSPNGEAMATAGDEGW
jgi:WD40 repeat protein